MSFKKNKYKIIRNALPSAIGNFLYFYFLLKRSVCKELQTKNDPMSRSYRHLLGQFGDEQIKTDCFVTYGDTAFDTLLELIRPVMEHHTKQKLIPTYSYARIYEKGDTLKKHKDRKSCEISTTLNLGGDPWPIFIKNTKGKKRKVDLKQRDMLIYRGSDLEHWRDPFKGSICLQVFLHYNEDKQKNKRYLYDGRKHLGIPK
jgi:hypothetical protein